jgi:predicted enzyme related to lactoylglutathione lyase
MNLNGILIGSEDAQRLKAAGAMVVQEPYQPDEDPEGWIATFADPDDNYFQLVSPFPG